jgi:uncharacterized protein YpmS
MKKNGMLLFFVSLFIIISASITFAKGVEIEENYVPDPAITAMIASNPQIIDNKLKAAMLNEVDNPASITIEITHISPKDTALGKFKRIYVYAYRSSVENVIIESAKIEFLDVELNTKKLIENEKIRPVNKCTINMDVIVKEKDLNAFLQQKTKKIKVDNPKVRMMNDSMELSGSTKYGFVKVEFWAKGNFTVKNNKEIWFHASKMKVNRISMPRNFIGTIIKKINPLMNFDKFSFNVNLRQIKITDGQIRITSLPN